MYKCRWACYSTAETFCALTVCLRSHRIQCVIRQPSCGPMVLAQNISPSNDAQPSVALSCLPKRNDAQWTRKMGRPEQSAPCASTLSSIDHRSRHGSSNADARMRGCAAHICGYSLRASRVDIRNSVRPRASQFVATRADSMQATKRRWAARTDHGQPFCPLCTQKSSAMRENTTPRTLPRCVYRPSCFTQSWSLCTTANAYELERSARPG